MGVQESYDDLQVTTLEALEELYTRNLITYIQYLNIKEKFLKEEKTYDSSL